MSEGDANHPASTADDPSTSPLATATVLPPQHWAQIEQAEEEENIETDSTLNADTASSTASITSSILDYRTIHGRTYHSDQGNAQYWGSNDGPQNELMDVTHHVLTRGIGDKLHLAPLEEDRIQQVIDIGTGTGTWAIDFADGYPGAEVIGTDISPIQPSWVPPNLQLWVFPKTDEPQYELNLLTLHSSQIEDCNQEWTFRSSFADYIHMRWLFGSIKDWNALCSEAFRVCKPGAWFESLEASTVIDSDDNTIDGDSAMGQWGKLFIAGSKKLGSSVTVVEDGTQKKAMEEAGFINIQEFSFKNPIGPWPKDPILKEMGAHTKYGLEMDSEGFILFMAHTLGWTRDEILVYIAHFRREMRSGKHHGYFAQRVVWGQKPGEAPKSP